MMLDYYDQRAAEYDEWYRGEGVFARRERAGWFAALDGLTAALGALAPARTLDLACGTGFLTRWLPGPVTGLDASPRMLREARERLPEAEFVLGDALAPPFAESSFERVFTGHFYGHLQTGERGRFLAQARRLANELVIVDSAMRPDHETEEWQERVLNDGSRHSVYKRYFTAEGLAAELGGATVVYDSPWFVAVSSRSSSR